MPVAVVVGASRGIGRQVAVDLGKCGYAVVVAAKSTSDVSKLSSFPPDPNSPQSTINTVEREIREAGGEAKAIGVDVRDVESVQNLIKQTVASYGGIDIIVYNSGAVWWSSVEHTPMKRFQLMQKVNPEGLYATIQAAFPVFDKAGWKGRIIVVSPPIYSRFFRGKTAYAMGKIGMSVLTKGLAMDFEREGKSDMAITSIWPAVAIQSGATREIAANKDGFQNLRKPTIFSDAILEMIRAPVSEVNGLLALDEDFLRSRGVTAFSKYSVVPGSSPRRIMPAQLPDMTVAEQDDEGQRVDSHKKEQSKL